MVRAPFIWGVGWTRATIPAKIRSSITGTEFSNTVNSLRLYQKEGGNFTPQVRIGWLNAIRKFFDWLDDTLGEVIDPDPIP